MPKINERKRGEDDAPTGPSVRLALGADIIQSVGDKALGPTVQSRTVPNQAASRRASQGSGEGDLNARAMGPVVRLANTTHSGATSPEQFERAFQESPQVRLAHVPGAQGDNNLLGQRGVEVLPLESRPALLVSYVYLQPFLENKHRYAYRDWVMDSGAFSAHNSGEVIVLQDYIDCCRRLLEEDPTLTEVFALDVIGDWKATMKNTEEMWRQGIPAIPCFHYGEPWDLLMGMARDYPKIALGGCVGKRDKDKFAGQCFGRVWPKKLHGFGFGSEKSILLHPWHSTDATNWEIAPVKYGCWKAFGGQRVSVRGSKQNLRAEVEWYLELEQKARLKWAKEMKQLETLEAPTIRLVGASDGREKMKPLERALSKEQRDSLEAPSVLLGLNLKNSRTQGEASPLVPTVRNEANCNEGREDAKASALSPPTVRLAHKESGREGGKGLEGSTE